MSDLDFNENIARAISEYKKIIRKKLSHQAYSQKVEALGIKRMQLRILGETSLLQIAGKIVNDLEETYTKNIHPRLYSGVFEFTSYLKNLLQSHRVENNRVINTVQKASAIMVEIAQIVSLPKSDLNDSTIDHLKSCVNTITQYGTFNQISLLVGILKQKGLDKVEFCSDQIRKLEEHLQTDPSETTA